MLRIILLFLLLCCAGCSQITGLFKKTTLAPEQLKTETLRVLESLSQKPDWLFSVYACPSEIMPEKGLRPLYLSDGCSGDPIGCIAKCRSDDPSACYSLALLIQEQTEGGDESSEALFLRSCKLGIVSGCTNRAANIFDVKKDDPAGEKCAVDTFEKACLQDDPWGCTMYGFALSEGIGRDRNISEGLIALSKACLLSSDAEQPACKRAKEVEKLISYKPEK
jgi:hypothetical protein